jgi:hypothetical protein
LFWLDRDRQKGPTDEWPTGERKPGDSVPAPPRGPSPHVVISGRQLREEILGYGPAFLHPENYSEADAFRALVTVLAAYALGSRTAARLVRERQEGDPSWQPPSRREAMQVVSSLNRLRQYLPYLIGQRLQAAAPGAAARPPSGAHGEVSPIRQAGSRPPQPARRAGADTQPAGGPVPRPVVQVAPAQPNPPRPVVNTRPPPQSKSAPVIVRPVISINKK